METMLIVQLNDEYFGFDSDIVNQILKIPKITPIPLTDKSFKGVSVIGGRVYSVVDLKQLLNICEVDLKDEKSRLITIQNNETGVLVDKIIDTVYVESDKYEENSDAQDGIVGFYKYKDDSLVQVIDILKMIEKGFVLTFDPLEIDNLSDKEENTQTAEVDTRRYLFFKAQNEVFAIDIELVGELLFVREITPVANTDKANLGAITLRNEVIEVFDFNMLFDFPKTQMTEKSRLLILKDENKKLGLLVEEVVEIKDVVLNNIEAVNIPNIQGLYKDNETIVSIVGNMCLKKLIDNYAVSEEKEEIEKGNENMKEITVFSIGEEEFAFDIEKVQEIIAYQEIIPVPESGEYIEGVINLRGSIVVIVNLPKKLNFESEKQNKIIVCNIEDEKVGFLVDEVNDVLFVEDSNVAISKKGGIVKSTISLNNGERVILELNVDKLVEIDEIVTLKENSNV